MNLLSLINSSCYADLDKLNFQTTMDDLKTLIDEANELAPDFRTDMEHLLTEVSCDCKVKWKKEEN